MEKIIDEKEIIRAKMWAENKFFNIADVDGDNELRTIIRLCDKNLEKETVLLTLNDGCDNLGNIKFSHENDCPICGKEIKAWYKFCPCCGQKIKVGGKLIDG